MQVISGAFWGLFLVFSATAYADPQGTMDEMNKQVEPAKPTCPACEEVFTNCLKALCKDEEELVTSSDVENVTMDKAANHKLSEENAVKKELESVATRFYSDWQNDMKDIDSKLMADPAKTFAGMSADDKKFFMLNFFMKSANILALDPDDKDPKHQEDYRKGLKAMLSSYSENLGDWFYKVDKAYYDVPGVYDAQVDMGEPASEPLKRLFPTLKYKDAAEYVVKDYFQKLDTVYNSVYKPLGMSRATFDESQNVEGMKALAKVRPYSEDFLKKTFECSRKWEGTLTVLAQMDGNLKISDSLIKELMTSDQFKREFASAKNTLGEQAEVDKLVKNQVSKCISKFTVGSVVSPKESEIKEFESKVLPKIKADVLSTVGAIYSPQTHQKLKDIFKNLKIQLPESKEKKVLRLMQKLKNLKETQLKEAKGERRGLRQLGSYSQAYVLWDGPLEEVCNNLVPGLGLSDHANISGESMAVSLGAIRLPGYQKTIVSHELGHIVDMAFVQGKASKHSTKVHEEIKACLIKQHGDAKTGGELLAEDYADLIAASVPSKKKTNLFCAMRKGFAGFNDEATVLDPVAEDLKYDKHSPVIFRALHFETVRNEKIPAECEAWMAQTKQKRALSSCAPKKK